MIQLAARVRQVPLTSLVAAALALGGCSDSFLDYPADAGSTSSAVTSTATSPVQECGEDVPPPDGTRCGRPGQECTYTDANCTTTATCALSSRWVSKKECSGLLASVGSLNVAGVGGTLDVGGVGGANVAGVGGLGLGGTLDVGGVGSLNVAGVGGAQPVTGVGGVGGVGGVLSDVGGAPSN